MFQQQNANASPSRGQCELNENEPIHGAGFLDGSGANVRARRYENQSQYQHSRSAQPIAGMMYELDAIAATVIGGTSLMGGEGSLGGTLVGALIMGVLRNGLNLLGVSSFLQQVVIGGVIVVAVLLDTVLKRKHRT